MQRNLTENVSEEKSTDLHDTPEFTFEFTGGYESSEDRPMSKEELDAAAKAAEEEERIANEKAKKKQKKEEDRQRAEKTRAENQKVAEKKAERVKQLEKYKNNIAPITTTGLSKNAQLFLKLTSLDPKGKNLTRLMTMPDNREMEGYFKKTDTTNLLPRAVEKFLTAFCKTNVDPCQKNFFFMVLEAAGKPDICIGAVSGTNDWSSGEIWETTTNTFIQLNKEQKDDGFGKINYVFKHPGKDGQKNSTRASHIELLTEVDKQHIQKTQKSKIVSDRVCAEDWALSTLLACVPALLKDGYKIVGSQSCTKRLPKGKYNDKPAAYTIATDKGNVSFNATPFCFNCLNKQDPFYAVLNQCIEGVTAETDPYSPIEGLSGAYPAQRASNEEKTTNSNANNGTIDLDDASSPAQLSTPSELTNRVR